MWIMWNAPGTTWISSLWKEMIFSTLPWISKVQPHGMRIKLFIYSCNEEPPKHCMESSQTIWLSRDGDCWSTIQNVPTIFLAMDLLILWFMLCVSSININYWTMSTKHVLDYGKQRIKSKISRFRSTLLQRFFNCAFSHQLFDYTLPPVFPFGAIHSGIVQIFVATHSKDVTIL